MAKNTKFTRTFINVLSCYEMYCQSEQLQSRFVSLDNRHYIVVMDWIAEKGQPEKKMKWARDNNNTHIFILWILIMW